MTNGQTENAFSHNKMCLFSFQLIVHSKSMVSVYEYIDQSQLPREYLPDKYDGKCAGTIQEIVGMPPYTFDLYSLIFRRLNQPADKRFSLGYSC